MSLLILRGHEGREFKMVITQFSSPMSATINSAQTRRMMNHFPIRAGQPDIQFTAQFTSPAERSEFYAFVRDHQLNALEDRYSDSETSRGAVTLIWPERDIVSWTGYIVDVPVEEVRFDYAPKLTFGVMLVNSLMGNRTFGLSLGASVDSIYGIQIPGYKPDAEDAANWFQLPNPPDSQVILNTIRAVQEAVQSAISGNVVGDIVNGTAGVLGQ